MLEGMRQPLAGDAGLPTDGLDERPEDAPAAGPMEPAVRTGRQVVDLDA
jgi:hypothetical protein